MAVFTKSIQEKKEDSDGIRICIMRRIKPEFVFDIWMPTLSPSTELLKNYHDKQIDWKMYKKRFEEEVLNRQKKYLQIVLDTARKNDVTLLCWEEAPEMCHRRLIAEKIQKLDPILKVNIN